MLGREVKQGRYLSQISEHQGRPAMEPESGEPEARDQQPLPRGQRCSCGLSMAALTSQGQNQVAARDHMAHKPKIFTTRTFAEKVCHLDLVS